MARSSIKDLRCQFTLASILICGLSVGGLITTACAEPNDIAPAWSSIEILDDHDRGIANNEIKKSVDWLDAANAQRDREHARVALVPLTDGSNLLLVRTANYGSCGNFDIAIFGPTRASGSNADPVGGLCTSEELKPRFRQTAGAVMPDLIVRQNEMLLALFPWTGSGWRSEPT